MIFETKQDPVLFNLQNRFYDGYESLVAKVRSFLNFVTTLGSSLPCIKFCSVTALTDDATTVDNHHPLDIMDDKKEIRMTTHDSTLNDPERKLSIEDGSQTPKSRTATLSAPSRPPSTVNKELDGEEEDNTSNSDRDVPFDSHDHETGQSGLGKAPTRTPPSLHLVQSHVPQPQTLPREIAFVAVICSAQLFTQAGLGQAVAIIHIIGDSFGTTNPGQLSWFAAAYSLTVGTFILIAGRLGDLYGHKRFFTAGFVWFGVWSLLAGFAVYVRHSPIFFDVCRAMQGIGPAFLLPNALAILGRTYPQGRRKEMIFSIFGATAPSGFLVGAIFASIFAKFAWWPWTFWTMGIMCFVMAIAGHFAIPHTPPPVIEKDGISMFTRVDGLGCITGVVALVLINFAWNQGPVIGWTTPYTYALLIVGFVFLALFGFIESRAIFPLLPRAALTKDTAFVLGCIAAGWSSFGIWVYYSWQFLEVLRQHSPLSVTAQFLPVSISGLAAAITSGYILHRVGPGIVMMIALTAFTTGLILMATAPVDQTYWAQTFIAIVVMPWGMDMSFPAAMILLSDHMPKEDQGVAASLVNTVVNYSISIGLGFAGTIEERVNDGGVSEEGILKGYRGAWYMGIGLAGLGVAISVAFQGSMVWGRSKRRGGGESEKVGGGDSGV